ncbi:MAG: hypothetical protein WAM44_05675 [Chthoniobacterales bacterium]
MATSVAAILVFVNGSDRDNNIVPASGTEELELIKRADWNTFPQRLLEQPIFYPAPSIDEYIEIYTRK